MNKILCTKIERRLNSRLRSAMIAIILTLGSLSLAEKAVAQVVVPSVALTSTAIAPGGTAIGTVVYNTATAGTGATAVKPGAYVWTGSEWRLADAKYFNTNSSLPNSQAIGGNSLAVGPGSIANGVNNIAVGTNALATSTNAIAIGNAASATGRGGVGSVAIGGGEPGSFNTGAAFDKANIANRAGTAVGFGSQANTNAVTGNDGGGSAFGTYSNANRGSYNTAIGYRADASSEGTLTGANPQYSAATTLGAFSSASAPGATTLGSNSSASVSGGVALGNFSVASRAGGFIGFAPLNSSAASISLINATNSTLLGAVSVGGGSVGATPLGNRQITNVAAGTNDSDAVNVSQLKALSAVVAALPAGGATGPTGPAGPAGPAGAAGAAGATGATGAMGAPGTSGAPVSVLEGNNIVASVSANGNQISISTVSAPTFTGVTTANLVVKPAGVVALGNNVITQVGAGVAPTDAANISQLENVAEQSRQYTDSRIGQLSTQVITNQKDANAGTAAAMAMAGMPQAFVQGKSMIAAGIGSYEGQSAVAIGVSKLSESGRWLLKINGAANSRGKAGVSFGAGYSW